MHLKILKIYFKNEISGKKSGKIFETGYWSRIRIQPDVRSVPSSEDDQTSITQMSTFLSKYVNLLVILCLLILRLSCDMWYWYMTIDINLSKDLNKWGGRFFGICWLLSRV